MVARLTPDQKVACSSHVGVIFKLWMSVVLVSHIPFSADLFSNFYFEVKWRDSLNFENESYIIGGTQVRTYHTNVNIVARVSASTFFSINCGCP